MKGKPNGKGVDNDRTDYAFALTARIDDFPLVPRVSLRSTLGYALLRLQRDNYPRPPISALIPLTFDLSP